MRASRLIVLPLLLTAGSGVGQAAKSPTEGLVVQSSVGVTPEAERALAELAEPRRIRLDPGQDRVELARKLCGRLTPTYVELLARANAAGDETMAVIPACFEVRLNERVAALPGETLSGFAERWVGLAGPKTIAAIRSANPRRALAKLGKTGTWRFLLGNGRGISVGSSSGQLTALGPAGDVEEAPSLVIPYRTEPVAYALRRGVDADDAAATITRALGADPQLPVLPTPADEIEIESGVDPQFLGPALCPTPLPAEALAWPYPVDLLLRVLQRNDEVRAGIGFPHPLPAAVAVVDNGVDGLFTFFPRDDLALNAPEFGATTPGGDEDGNNYVDDIAGLNVFGGPPLPQAETDPEHGTLMAGLVLGGPEFRRVVTEANLRRRVQFRAISLLKREVRGTPQGNQTTISMPLDGLNKAILYSRDSQIWTVNLSVTVRVRPTQIEDLLFNNPNLLLVVASGNEPLPLDDGEARYPASFSRLELGLRGKVVTVGSHDRRGCFSAFAAMGPQTVDLAAPGEGITSTGLGGVPITGEGTSQATALVSFTAALLRNEGMVGASAVKDRLLASVDLKPHLAQFVRSQGALNTVKALSLNDDVLELSAFPGRMLFGKLTGQLDLAAICAGWEDPRPAHILKISKRVDGGDAEQIRVMFKWLGNPDIAEVRYCRPVASTFTFREAGGVARGFRLGDVVDFVPAR